MELVCYIIMRVGRDIFIVSVDIDEGFAYVILQSNQSLICFFLLNSMYYETFVFWPFSNYIPNQMNFVALYKPVY